MTDLAQVAFNAYYGSAADFRGETEQSRSLWRRVAFMVVAHAEKFDAEGNERAPSQLDRIESATKSILEEIHNMAEDQAQLDTAIAAVGTEITALGTALNTSLTDLLAKIASNPNAPVADFTSEVTLLQGFATQLSSLQATAAADDPGAPAAASTPAASTPATS